jgi:hypothetical protein
MGCHPDGERVSGSDHPRVARLWKQGQGGARRGPWPPLCCCSESTTCAAPAGAGPLNVTVPVEEFLVGFSASEETERVGGGEDSARNLF